MHCDNQGAVFITNNPSSFHKHTSLIEINYHVICNKVFLAYQHSSHWHI